jgi:membrane protease YdiL (CAAX protease family)
MIQGYRMAGPPPHGEPPPTPPTEREWPVWLGFVTLFAVFLVSNVVYGIVLSASGADIDDTPAWLDLSAAVILQGSLLAGALVAATLIKPVHPWQFGLIPTKPLRAVGWAVLGMVAFYILAAIWVSIIGDPEQSTAEDIGAEESDLALYAAGVMFIFVAPVIEEIFFRGFFYGSLRTRLPVGWAALIGGVVFGAIHVGTGASAVPILMVLGVIFCLVRELTGSLYPCIAMHAFNNTLAYAGQTDVDIGVALAFGAVMLTATFLVPRFVWRRPPQPAPTAA